MPFCVTIPHIPHISYLYIHTNVYIVYEQPRTISICICIHMCVIRIMQMVATEDTQSSDFQNTTDNTGAFEKLKQTLSSSLLTAQDKGKCHFTFVNDNQKNWF